MSQVIAEATMLTLLKGTLATGGSAWLVVLAEGRWIVAAVAVIPLTLAAINLRHHSRRQRGKCGDRGG